MGKVDRRAVVVERDLAQRRADARLAAAAGDHPRDFACLAALESGDAQTREVGWWPFSSPLFVMARIVAHRS
jgi:hypothetical protein